MKLVTGLAPLSGKTGALLISIHFWSNSIEIINYHQQVWEIFEVLFIHFYWGNQVLQNFCSYFSSLATIKTWTKDVYANPVGGFISLRLWIWNTYWVASCFLLTWKQEIKRKRWGWRSLHFQEVAVTVWPSQAQHDSHTRTQRMSTRLQSKKESTSSFQFSVVQL